jgi:hypothetical protein
MLVAEMVLRYLQALLAWPPVVLVLGIVALKMFREPLADFFRRLTEGEAYGVRVKATTPAEQRKEIKEVEEASGPPKLQSAEDVERYIRDNPKAVMEELARTSNSFRFEKTYNLIYGTQIDLLEHLTTKGDEGESYTNLARFYNEFVRRSGLQTTQMADYLGFLKEAGLAEYVGYEPNLRLRITPFGLNFLSYIKGQYAASYRLKPF